ncbi:hypothetical protein, partial [Saliniramus sp.]|uniref:hypothetical protein n=1 Tax=Saliniramus sp. TaxID=2986772 RepID=UPI002B54C556
MRNKRYIFCEKAILNFAFLRINSAPPARINLLTMVTRKKYPSTVAASVDWKTTSVAGHCEGDNNPAIALRFKPRFGGVFSWP